jgi:hypothetical protein
VIPAPLTKQERRTLLEARRAALAKYEQAMNRSGQHPPWSDDEARALAEAEQHLAEAERVEAAYFDRLPRLTLSTCPFDGRPLVRSFDPFGLDGPWWRSDATPDEAPTCPHFCVLLGAVSFAGRPALAGDFDVHPGPEVPYVIPRLLAHPEMTAVLSRLEMENACVAYPIAYFARRRPPPQHLTAGWVRTNFVYTTQLGEGGWRIPNDPWDFDLGPWLAEGKIRWCVPGSDNSALSTEPPDRCPYLNLPGERQRLVVRGDRVQRRGVPTGEPAWPTSL